MKKLLGSFCFWLGDLISKCDRLKLSDYEWFAGLWYPVYNKLMIWSDDLNPDLWESLPDHECRCGCYSGGCDAPGGCRCGKNCPCQNECN